MTTTILMLLPMWLFTIQGHVVSAREPDPSLLILENTNAGLRSIKGLRYYEGVLLTGTVVSTNAEGERLEAIPYVDGRKEGYAKAWYENGVLKDERLYAEGKRKGLHLGWWPDGSMRFTYLFKDDLHEGAAYEWHLNGTLTKAFNYMNGKEVGNQKMWRADGELRANYVVKDGRRYGLMGSKPCTSNQ